MYIETSIIIAGALGLLLLFAGVRRLLGRRILTGSAECLSGFLLIAIAALLFSLLGNFYTYHRLLTEQSAAELRFDSLGKQHYEVSISYPSGDQQVFNMHGDEWQLDARILKWRGYATLIGFDTVYRLDRLSGRYQDTEQERRDARSVYALSEDPNLDLWALARRYGNWVPWVDARYGSAAYLPMADEALYAVNVTQAGLVARPLNEPAQTAVRQWR